MWYFYHGIVLGYDFPPPNVLFWITRLLIKYCTSFPSHTSHFVHVSVPMLEFLCCGESLSKAALTTIFPSLLTTCINPIGWHLATETFTAHISSLYKLHIWATGFLFDSWTLKMGPIDCPELLVRNYHYLLCNNPEERSYQELSCSVKTL